MKQFSISLYTLLATSVLICIQTHFHYTFQHKTVTNVIMWIYTSNFQVKTLDISKIELYNTQIEVKFVHLEQVIKSLLSFYSNYYR
jgi:hypothetical protein